MNRKATNKAAPALFTEAEGYACSPSVSRLETLSGCSLEALSAGWPQGIPAEPYQIMAGEYTSGLPAIWSYCWPSAGLAWRSVGYLQGTAGHCCAGTPSCSRAQNKENGGSPKDMYALCHPISSQNIKERHSQIHDHQSRIPMHDGQRSNLCRSMRNECR